LPLPTLGPQPIDQTAAPLAVLSACHRTLKRQPAQLRRDPLSLVANGP
jgi:hypothetical protein